ncbi:MAG: hydrogenase expression/formation protein HypE [Deltaproteobacteria bacterium]|nr:hydrogenase expression/formation protein HypE [Deltaproteobacteria bacterium]
MRDLVTSVFLRGITAPEAMAMDDGAAIPWGDKWLVVTTDAHVVSPVEFPGGDIGRLSVCGVVNDLAMMGATDVLALTSAVIVEEGFDLARLSRLSESARRASDEASAPILAGDTKVMRRGELDGIVLSTSGLAVAERVVRDAGMRVDDAIVVTGTIGDHGLAVLAARERLGLDGALVSDVAPLNGLVRTALAAVGDAIHAMKDPTRGGVVSALSEMATKAGVAVHLSAQAIPMSAPVRAASELLGIDPLWVANEGKALIVVERDAVEPLLRALRDHPLGRDAAAIGHVAAGEPGALLLDTGFGTRRLFERDGEPLPRIC